MHRPSRPYSLPSALLFLGIGISLVVTQTGCPGGAELENPDAWAGRFGGNSGGAPAATGGSTTGGSTSGGTGGTGNTNWVLDPATVVCPGGLNAATVITGDCAKGGCHKGALAAAGLDLSFSPNNIAKNTKDVIATHEAIQCSAPTEPYMECIPMTCPGPGTALLVNSANPDDSWVLKKIHGTANGCGDTMPDDSYATASPDKLACVDAVFRAIAALK
jgi:hypothetical protein